MSNPLILLHHKVKCDEKATRNETNIYTTEITMFHFEI